MLELKNLDAGYGGFQALFGINLDVKAGEAVGVIGPNGAGKTTLMRVISGLIRPTRGTIAMEGTDVVATPAHLIVGSLDPLLDDSNMLAARLKAAGVPHDLTVYQGINHGFIRYGRLIGTARRAIAECAAALKTGLAA